MEQETYQLQHLVFLYQSVVVEVVALDLQMGQLLLLEVEEARDLIQFFQQ